MASRLMNEGPRWIFLVLWILTNIGLFIGYFIKFNNSKDYFYLRKITGLGLPFARGSAACLNFNCMLILLPVCRNLITFIRGSCKKCCKRSVTRQLDKNITFHKLVAYMICLHTAIHYFAHTANFEHFLEAHDSPANDNITKGLLSALSNLPTTPNGTYINPIRTPNTNPMLELVKCVPGITGVLITVSLILIVSSATEIIRRSYFEVFWYTHHLFVIFFIALVVHGVGGLVRGQINTAQHDPILCWKRYKEWGRLVECPEPHFAPGGAMTWKWVLAPVVLYIIERIIRLVRSCQKVTLIKVVKHPSKVIELQMQKKNFSMEAGEYIFIQCPSISRLEWHPFTLTSAPGDDYFSVHIRIVGDWTGALAKACKVDDKDLVHSEDLPALYVDGPFGTASEDVFRYDTDILVGAGIGVTPFAAVLKDIWYRHLDPSTEMKLKKVHVYWICPDTQAFEWFADLLGHLETQMAESGKPDLLDYNIYLTRGWDANQAMNIVAREGDEEDAITGLKQKTFYGRPNWDQIFGAIAEQNQGVRVGVFFCGPAVLSKTLHKMSNKYSSTDPKGTHFVYNKENF